jgi:coenzyme F420-reducing hydrogenase delta subunit/ferredoxin
LFSLLVFLHIGIPLALLLGMWAHIQRTSRPRTSPPRLLAFGLTAALVLLSLAKPATSDAPADLALAPSEVNPDWIYQAIHPLFYASSGTLVWIVAGVLTVTLVLLPWLPPARRPPVARVDLANCNGCGRCFADCPYVAVTMRPRSDGRPLAREAVVDADLCAACGICAGACPSSTPFRSGEVLHTGIDLPQRPIGGVREELTRALAKLRGAPRVVVFGCDRAANAKVLQASDTAVLSLPCAAMWPPSFVEYALRSGVDGVLIAGCRDGDCAYRLGNRWVEERVRGVREPHLRGTVPVERVETAWCGPFDDVALAHALSRFRERLGALPAARFAAFKRRQEVVDG